MLTSDPNSVKLYNTSNSSVLPSVQLYYHKPQLDTYNFNNDSNWYILLIASVLGNTFSTLEGVKFTWNIDNLIDGDDLLVT